MKWGASPFEILRQSSPWSSIGVLWALIPAALGLPHEVPGRPISCWDDTPDWAHTVVGEYGVQDATCWVLRGMAQSGAQPASLLSPKLISDIPWPTP